MLIGSIISAYETNNSQKILSSNGIKNVFYPIEELKSPEVQLWISKSKHELNRFAQFILSLHNFEKEKPNYHTCQALHESLNGCSVSIVFSLFNIFAIITKTKASFFDQSIRDYFMERVRLSFEQSYLLSFLWHEPVLSMNSLGYSSEQYLKTYFVEDGVGFKVLKSRDGRNTSDLERNDNEEIINSLEFYTFHLFQLLSTIDIVANLLNPDIFKTSSSQAISYLHVENYHDLHTIYENILKKMETAS
jgi:hypothetical protein